MDIRESQRVVLDGKNGNRRHFSRQEEDEDVVKRTREEKGIEQGETRNPRTKKRRASHGQLRTVAVCGGAARRDGRRKADGRAAGGKDARRTHSRLAAGCFCFCFALEKTNNFAAR